MTATCMLGTMHAWYTRVSPNSKTARHLNRAGDARRHPSVSRPLERRTYNPTEHRFPCLYCTTYFLHEHVCSPPVQSNVAWITAIGPALVLARVDMVLPAPRFSSESPPPHTRPAFSFSLSPRHGGYTPTGHGYRPPLIPNVWVEGKQYNNPLDPALNPYKSLAQKVCLAYTGSPKPASCASA